ncbi:MAG TPA: DUF3093 domain-containing protein [Actinomycetes bacterium]
MRAYDERLWPPVWLWVAGWLFALSLGLAFLAALGPVGGLLATVLPGALVTWSLLASAAVVRVEDGQLQAGRARMPVSLLGPPVVLDAERARAVRGPSSDPAAYHLIRGWVPAGVFLDVTDPADPTPYWFVASRHPDRLAAAVERAREAAV